MLPDFLFYSVITFLFIELIFIVLIFLTAHIIQGLFGLSGPLKAKFIEEIGVSLCTPPAGPAQSVLISI